ncbi:M48 family metalloprotease [Streptomyces sp. NPDC000878]
MTTAPAGAPAPVASPDPFALPSGTKFRFVLVVTALVGTMVFIHNLLYFTIAPAGERAVTVYQQCAAAPPTQGSGTDALAYTQGFLSCIAPYERQKAWWILTGILLLAVTAAAVYLFLPGFLVRRSRMEPLSPNDPDQAPLLTCLHELCREAGLSRPPEFLLSGVRGADAAAFGRRGRYRVVLDQGTAMAFHRAPRRFRGVVLHELAHLRNKDVDVTYLTIALALAFVPTGLLPLAVALAGTPPQEFLGVAWRALVLVALVATTCASVLRAREYGADVRVVTWGAGQGLLEALGPGTGRRAPWWWRGPLAPHPPVARRADEIGRPKELFRIGFAECLATGLAVSVAANGLLTLLWLLANRLDALDARWTIVLVCAPAALAVVGLGVWRAALLAHGTTGRPPATALPALGLAVGLIVGQPLAPQNGIVLTDRQWWPGQAALAWSLVLCLLVVALVAWIAQTAGVWYAVQEHPPGGTWPVGQLAAVVPFAVLLSGWMFLYDTSDGLGPVGASTRELFDAVSAAAPVGPYWVWAAVEHPMVLQFTQWTPVVAAVVALWLFPVAALWRRGASPDMGWIRTVLTTSLVAAGCFAVLQLVLRVALHQGVGPQTRDQDGFVLAFAYWQIGGAMLLQGVVAAVTAFQVRGRYARLTAPFALMAAFLTGCLATVLLFGGVVLAGCVDALAIRPGPCTPALPPDLVRNTLLRILVGGFLCALVGLAAALFVLRLRGARTAVPPLPLRSPPRHRQLAISVACLSAVSVLGLALAVDATGDAPGPAPAPPSPPTVSSAAACRTFDGLLGPDSSPAETNAQLYEAIQLARLAGNDRLATAFQGLFTAAGNQDTLAFGARVEEIRTLCAAEGAVLRNLP